MKKNLILIMMFTAVVATASSAVNLNKVQYTKGDSSKVVSLIRDARRQPRNTNTVIYLARRLRSLPYVAKTLEKNKYELLVVNLRQLDCTTYVENVLAMYLCVKYGKLNFSDFCNYLREIRYDNGNVSYTSRLHYFSQWIDENTGMGFVKEVQSPNPPFTAVHTINIGYMSAHPDKYPMINRRPELIKRIKKMEDKINGRTYRYIPKTSIANTTLMRRTVHDGDIIAITTRKAGLDISHIGFAVWHKDGLHLLNASMLRKRVVEEPKTLRSYMSNQRTQTGIRVIRVK